MMRREVRRTGRWRDSRAGGRRREREGEKPFNIGHFSSAAGALELVLMADQKEVQRLLSVLVRELKVPAMEAMQMIPRMVAAGVNSVEALEALDGKKLEGFVPDAKLRRKMAGALTRKRKKVGGGGCGATGEAGKKGEAGGARENVGGHARGVSSSREHLLVEPTVEKELSSAELRELSVVVNRSPVMVIWAAAVARLRGFTWESALSLAQASADWYAQKKGEYLGILLPRRRVEVAIETAEVELVGVKIRTVKVDLAGRSREIRALDVNGNVIPPSKPAGYISRAFGSHIGQVYRAFVSLAAAMPEEEIVAGSSTYHAYERFRPNVSKGNEGWGARSRVKLEEVLELRDVYLQLAGSQTEQEIMAAKDEQEALPAKVEQEALPAKVEQEALPAKVEQEALPAKDEQEAIPAKDEQQVIPAKEEQDFMATKTEPKLAS